MIKKWTILGPLLALGLGLSACGDDDVTPVDGGMDADMDAGDSGTDGGVDGGDVDGGVDAPEDTNNNMSMCSGATVIGCGTGTIMGDTSGGTTNFNTYCGQGDIYLGEENLFEMVNDSSVLVTVSATADSDESDMDIYAFTSDAQCSSSETCIAGSAEIGRPTETMSFVYQPGSNTFIGYDTFNETEQPAGGTTSYSMTVSCSPIATQVTGMLDNTDVAWTRPDAGCEAGETMNHFELVEYTNETSSDQILFPQANYGYDGFLFRYNSSPNGSMPIDGCVVGNDDGSAASNSFLPPFILPAGETTYFAISAYGAEPDGGVYGDFNFTAFISDGCGDGTVGPNFEACDDGNTTSGDGCDALCAVEDGYTCPPEGGACTLACGNGTVDRGETCDDGNTTAGDGCSDACAVEDGYVCPMAGAPCELSCGNGTVDGSDACDDGNTTDGDGCSASCEVESGYACFGSPSACTTSTSIGMGTLNNMDTAWTRPNADCSASTRMNHFETVSYENTTGAVQTLSVNATYDFDGYLFVYDAAPNGMMPAAGCIEGNDDGSSSRNSRLVVEVGVGETVYFAVSAFGAEPMSGVYGNFELVGVAADAFCGDGVIQAIESCDDGATVDGDGCSAFCQIEGTSFCSGAPSTCEVGVCGDNMVTGAEVCDDGNTDATDGCSCTEMTMTGMLASTDMTWNRANDQCMGSTMGNFYYDVVELEWNGADGVTIDAFARFGDDGFLHIFNGFDASMPEAMCLAGNDNFILASLSRAQTPMMNGQTYQFVLSTAMPSVETDWELSISRAE